MPRMRVQHSGPDGMLEADDSWLDEPGPSSAEIIADRMLAMATGNAIAEAKARPKYGKNRELVVAMRKLHFTERLFVRAMEAAAFDVAFAVELLNGSGVTMTAQQGHRINKRPRVEAAIELAIAASLKRRGVTRDRVLSDVSRLRDYGMELAPEYVQGKPTGARVMRSPELALNALDKLGKHTKAWADETSNRVTVGIQVIDYTASRAESLKSEGKEVIEAEVIPDGEAP